MTYVEIPIVNMWFRPVMAGAGTIDFNDWVCVSDYFFVLSNMDLTYKMLTDARPWHAQREAEPSWYLCDLAAVASSNYYTAVSELASYKDLRSFHENYMHEYKVIPGHLCNHKETFFWASAADLRLLQEHGKKQ